MNSSSIIQADITGLDVLWLISGIFCCIAVILLALQFFTSNKQVSKELWLAYRLEFVIVSALIIPAFLGGIFLLITSILFSLRAIHEIADFYHMSEKIRTQVILSILTTAILILFFFKYYQTVIVLFFVSVISFKVMYLKDNSFVQMNRLLLPLTLSLMALLALSQLNNGFIWITLAYLVTELNDAFAYILGKSFGKHHPFPKLSPKKTTEGIVGGFVVSLIVGLVFCIIYLEISYSQSVILLGIIIASGFAGDLMISKLKRHHGVKDFKVIHISMGGVLDIYDAVLFALPVLFIFLTIVNS